MRILLKLCRVIKSTFFLIFVRFILFNNFLIKPICRWVLRSEREKEKLKLQEVYQLNIDNDKKIFTLTNENQILEYRLLRLKDIKNKYKGEKCELLLTKNEELVVIVLNNTNKISSINLLSEYGEHHDYDCQISFTESDSEIKILDFSSRKKNSGYGRTLMKFTIEQAKKKGVKRIKGDLSDTDSYQMLIPFYESFGFKCEIFNDPTSNIIGSILLELNGERVQSYN